MRRPVLIFDFGNVIAFFDWRRTAATLGERLGISADAFLELATSRGLPLLSARYEKGELSTLEFSAQARRLLDQDLGHDEFAAAWVDIFTLNEPVARLVAELKGAGYTLVLGSNTNELHARHFRCVFEDALAPFDGLVLSYEVGHLKPAREFYLACAGTAGASPNDCIFIDDLAENVAGAVAAGLQGIVFRDEQQLRVDLLQLGVQLRGD